MTSFEKEKKKKALQSHNDVQNQGQLEERNDVTMEMLITTSITINLKSMSSINSLFLVYRYSE